MHVVGSAKSFFGGLAKHWVWTIIFLLVLAPVLLSLLTPVRAKLAGLPVIGKLVGGGGSVASA
jgi:hypothetical protein